jgi:hypothetical protein
MKTGGKLAKFAEAARRPVAAQVRLALWRNTPAAPADHKPKRS